MGWAVVLSKEKAETMTLIFGLEVLKAGTQMVVINTALGKKKERNYVEFPILVCLHGYSGKKEKNGGDSTNLHFPHRKPLLLFSSGLKVLARSILILFREGNRNMCPGRTA